MECRFDSGKLVLFIGLCIAVFLALSVPSVSGQISYSSGSSPSVSYGKSTSTLGSTAQAASTAGSDRAYCVGNGFLYRITPGVNSGQPICQFSDYAWCDASEFAAGNCGADYGFFNPYGFYYPYNFDFPVTSSLTPGRATSACTSSGGRVQSVHTPYGDVDMCVFPNGSTLDLYGLYDGILGDSWYYYANSFLNAP